MSRRTKRCLALTAVVVSGLTLMGCTSGSGGSEASGVLSTASPAPRGVTLTIWNNDADTAALKSMYTAYEKESGNKLSFVSIPSGTFPFVVQSKWATGARPDILEWHGNSADAAALNMKQEAVDLSSLPFVKEEGSYAKYAANVDGKVYGAMLGPVSVSGVFYNKAIFAAAGLQPPQDYADLASDCTVLKAKESGVTPIFEAGGSGFPPAFLAGYDYTAQADVGSAYTNELLKGTAKLSDATGPLVSGLKAYDALRTSGCFNSGASTATWAQSTKALLDGKAAIVAGSSDDIAQLDTQANGDTKAVDSKIGFVGVSATKPVAPITPSTLGTYYVPKTSSTTKERAAVDFIRFITSAKEYQKYVDDAGSIPVLNNVTSPTLQGLWQDVKTAAAKTPSVTVDAGLPGFGSNFGNESDDLLAGQQTPSVVGTKMQTYFSQAQEAAGGN